MNNSHYPSLELCKKLTEIGFPVTEKVKVGNKVLPIIGVTISDLQKSSVCPSIMEMLDVIPTVIKPNGQWCNMQCGKGYATYSWWEYEDEHTVFEAYQPLPNALAEMILWLHENKHLTFSNGN